MAISGAKSCLPLVSLPNTNLVIGILKIKLYKDLGLSKAVYRLSDQRQQCLVLDSDIVKPIIVNL
jgi:hypothetical protein